MSTYDTEWTREDCGDDLTPMVRLYDARGAGLVIRHLNGIWYSNQAGGQTCAHPAALGIYVPYELVTLKNGAAWSLDSALSSCEWTEVALASGMSEYEADQVDAVLAEFRLLHIKVDRRQLWQSWKLGSWLS